MTKRRALMVIYISAAFIIIIFSLFRLHFGQTTASSQAQQNPTMMPRSVREACPRGYIIPFLIGDVTLFADIDHVMNATIYEIDQNHGKNCPTGPIKIHQIYLQRVAAALGIQSGIGVDSERIWVEEPPHRNPPPVADMEKSPTAPWVEDLDVTDPIRDPRLQFPDVRRYRLHYRAEDGTEALPEVHCGGTAIARLCGRMGHGYGGLIVAYSVSQARLPIPGPGDGSINPATEPRALLQFELRLRAWILGMERPPEKPR